MKRRTKFQNVFQKWQARAALAELESVALRIATSVPVLRQIANAYRTEGALSTKAETAIAIEKAAKAIHRPGLPELRREHFCGACAACEFAKEHRKNEKAG
jgi:hypothetical protein